MRTRILATWNALLACALIIFSGPAFPDFGPMGSHHAPLGSASGFGSESVSSSGNFATSVPLDLPTPRGNVPDPVSVVHQGGNQVGEAGVGWSIPLSYVFRSTSVSRRKPVFTTSGNAPVAPTRIFMSIGGVQTLMSRVSSRVGLYRPFASEAYSELRGPGPTESGPEHEWVFIDSTGRQFLFERIEALNDPALWLLTRVTDTLGNKVLLRYQIRGNSDGKLGKEINLVEVEHSHLAGARNCPKYRILLNYGPELPVIARRLEEDPILPAPGTGPVLGYKLDHGKVQMRRRLLEKISVRAHTEGCDADGQELKSYRFFYEPDTDSGLPRLVRVSATGLQNAGPLPVANYKYGAAQTGTGYEYKLAKTISFPADAIGRTVVSEDTSLLGSLVNKKIFTTTSAWGDFTGDGRPDFVLPEQNASTLAHTSHFINQPNGTLLGIQDMLSAVPNLSEQTRREFKSWAGGKLKSAVIETWRQMFDWNGDGRIDIVDARGGKDKDHWKIMLSFPSNNGGVRWVSREVNTYSLRRVLKDRGHQGIRDDQPLPISRTQTVGYFKAEICLNESGRVGECLCRNPDPNILILVPCQEPNRPSQTVTEWKVQDINGDGFADFLLNSKPIMEKTLAQSECKVCDSECPTCDEIIIPRTHFCDSAQPGQSGQSGQSGQDCKLLESRLDIEEGNRVLVYYNNNGAGVSNPSLTYEFTFPASPTVLLNEGIDVCGIERWSMSIEGLEGYNSNTNRVMTCGFREVNGDGLVDRIDSDIGHARLNTGEPFGTHNPIVLVPGRIRQSNKKEDICKNGADDFTPYEIRSDSELIDLTSDGIPDFVFLDRRKGVWHIRVGSGVGFGPSQELKSLTGKFEISVVRETCKEKESLTIAGLVDFDGDGSPDVVHATSGSLEIQRLGAGGGVLSAGRLVEVGNGYGGVTVINYSNAKNDLITPHIVPFPEIVVAEIRPIDKRDHTRSLDPVYFGYGDAQMQYNPLLARWTFPGYGRQVTLRGVSSPNNTSVTGTAVIEQRLRPNELPVGLARYVLAGQLKNQQLLVGTFSDAWTALGLVSVDEPRLQGGLLLKHAMLNTNASDTRPSEECRDVDPVTFLTSSPTLCRSTAVVWESEKQSWRGTSAPPSTEAVETRSRVTKVDAFGRVERMRNYNDTARADDDVCIRIAYAMPVGSGLLGVLNGVSSVHLKECTDNFVFSGQRYKYDNLPEGLIRTGLPTAVILERYNAATGENLGEIKAQNLSYDSYGNVAEVSLERSDTVKRTTKFDYDAFGLATRSITSTASDIHLPSHISYSRDPRSLLPWFVEDSNGVAVSFKHDNFGRATRTTLIDAAKREYMLGETVYLGDDPADPDGNGRSITQRSFNAWIPADAYSGPTQAVRETTTYFDSFGRAGASTVDLGADYGKTLIEGERSYDGLGRISFAADTYVKGEATPYGTSYLYKADGSLRCAIRGVGYQTDSTVDVSTDRYPTCFTYGYSARKAFTQVRTPSEMLSTSPQAGAFTEKRFSAIGWELSQARFKQSARTEYAKFSYDHLGQLKRIDRAKNPDVRTPTMVSWSLVNDSFGQTISSQEPGSPLVRTVFDDWGSPVSTSWFDSTPSSLGIRGTRSVYDGFGRIVHREATLNGDRDPAFSQYDYFYDAKSDDPLHAGATNLRGRIAWVSDRKGGGETFPLLTYYSYDSLGHPNRTVYRDVADNEAVEQEHLASPMGETLQHRLKLLNGLIDETIAYKRDSAGRVKLITLNDTNDTSLAFEATDIDPLGSYLAVKFGNGVTEKKVYRPDRRRELLSVVLTGKTFSRTRQYIGYDAEGRLSARQERCLGSAECDGSLRHTMYSYDALHRLARSRTVSGQDVLIDEGFIYDGLGNILRRTDAVAPKNSRLYIGASQDADQLCRTEHPESSTTGCSFSYDARGNVIGGPDESGVMRRFEYDPSARLVRMNKGAMNAVVRYDAFGEVNEIDQTNTAQYLRRERRYGSLVTKTQTGAHNFIERRIIGPLGTVALTRGTGPSSVVEYVHADESANRSFSGENGEETQAVSYRPFGAVMVDSGIEGESSYVRELWNQGDRFAAFGVTQLGARFYDEASGRFLQRDPVVAGRSSNHANPYSFAFNDPVNFIDPNGRQPEVSPIGIPSFENGGLLGTFASGMLDYLSSSFSSSSTNAPRPSLFDTYVAGLSDFQKWKLSNEPRINLQYNPLHAEARIGPENPSSFRVAIITPQGQLLTPEEQDRSNYRGPIADIVTPLQYSHYLIKRDHPTMKNFAGAITFGGAQFLGYPYEKAMAVSRVAAAVFDIGLSYGNAYLGAWGIFETSGASRERRSAWDHFNPTPETAAQAPTRASSPRAEGLQKQAEIRLRTQDRNTPPLNSRRRF